MMNGMEIRKGYEMTPNEPVNEQISPQMLEAVRQMAMLLRTTNERLAALENEVRRLRRVTPAQATEIGTAIRQRAVEVCQMHRATGAEKSVAAAIRKAVYLTCGVRSMRELPRDDFTVAMQQVKLWDDYKIMKAIRERSGNGGRKGSGSSASSCR